MIRTIIQISLLRLWHNKPELVLTFVVPILFFSIFAWIFGSRGGSSIPQIRIAVCDELRSKVSRATIELLEKSPSLRMYHPTEFGWDASKPKPFDRAAAEMLVRRGVVSAAIIFAAPAAAEPTANPPATANDPRIDVMADSFDQVAGQVIMALVQKSMINAQIQQASSRSNDSPWPPNGTSIPAVALASHANSTQNSQINNLLPISMIDVMGERKANPMIAMYAAGIAVMFLLFSATTASGSLLDERENSTLERLLCSRMTMDHLLMGKWCYLVLIGIMQMTLMFVFGAIFFGLHLIDHLDGFVAMTIVTASAAASFALMLAAICRSRTQLGWVSTMIILSMSALGGSMVPRYLMSESIQRVGQFTFNAWALDGYNKIFWRELPIAELQNELTVLVVCAFVFMVIARVFATRWDRT